MAKFLDETGLSHLWEKIEKADSGLLFGTVDSTSTSTVFTATVPGLTELRDGVTVVLKNGVVTSASGFTININNLGAKPVYTNLAAETRDTTIFNVAYTMMFIYDSDRGENGGWICFRGYDANTNTIGYQLRTNSSPRPAADKGYRYRLWFQTLDGKWTPANTSSSTNATSSRTPNTRVIDPFGEIIYYSTNGTTNADANLSAVACWQQYTLSLGYSFNTTGAALTLTFPAPVYVQCTPQSGGGAVLNGYTQSLPSTEDGKIYIFLGMAYNATNIELYPSHPVYYYKDGGIRPWTYQEPPVVILHETVNGNTYSLDKTAGEIYNILVSGRMVMLYKDHIFLPLKQSRTSVGGYPLIDNIEFLNVTYGYSAQSETEYPNYIVMSSGGDN